jgi:hypothetical protein
MAGLASNYLTNFMIFKQYSYKIQRFIKVS